MSREEKTDHMLSMVKRWQQSGQGQKEFAVSNNINLHTLQYWIRKGRQAEGTNTGFLQLDNSVIGTGICLRYPNGVELLLPVHTPINMVKGLVHI